MARSFEEGTRRTIGQIDNILLSARAAKIALGGNFSFGEWTKSQIRPDEIRAQISMADSTGHMFASTLPIPDNINIADRPHFRAQIDPTHDDLFISHPMKGRVSGKDTIQFTRKLFGPQREFAGVAVFSLDSAELSRFYESIDQGNGVVSLLSTDGTILARGPMVPGVIGSGIRGSGLSSLLTDPKGSFNRQKIGSAEQIVSFRRLREYPLIVVVGFDTDVVFRDYISLRSHAVMSGLGITLALSLVGALWIRQKQRSLASNRALMITLNTIGQGILMVDRRGGVPVVNFRALDFLGLPNERSEAVVSAIVARATQLEERNRATARLIPKSQNEISYATARDHVFETARDDGKIIEVHTHTLPDGEFVHTYTDVTEQRIADARVRFLAYHDALTGLANRTQLREILSRNLDRRPDAEDLTACIMLDLDGFKGINDTLGHQAGDELLIEVARRLQSLVRETDIVARLGGDEFVILVSGVSHPEDVVPLVQRVLTRLAAPEEIKGQQVRIGASVGIAFHPQDGDDADALIKNADLALYSAKAGGRGSYRFFDEQLALAANEHRRLETDLRGALEDEALSVHFQPKFESNSLEIVGFEALARWKHPTRGYVSPITFIRIAEDCGLISSLGLWVMERACVRAMTWEPRVPVAVNVSVAQLRHERLRDDVAAILRRTGLPPEFLEIEVTESVLADDDRHVVGNLQSLKAMGLHISLDDFGTGYSSLSYLRRFPFDKIKIDKSFVQSLETDLGVRIILKALLGMCHNLGLETVAEGVETQRQLALLQDLGCREVQGYLLGRPMPGDSVPEFIRNNIRLRGENAAATAVREKVLLDS